MRSFETIRESLTAKLNQLENRQEKLTRDLRQPGDPDSEERAQEMENDEVLEDLEMQSREEISKIRQALQRIDSGSYGVCGECGEDIAEGRLEALPHTDVCIDCAT
jgi:RNA polymerase-binding protein DksA